MTNHVLNQSVFYGADAMYKWATYCAATGDVRLRKRKPTMHDGKLQAQSVGVVVSYPMPLSTPGAEAVDEVLQREDYRTRQPVPRTAPPMAPRRVDDTAPALPKGFESCDGVMFPRFPSFTRFDLFYADGKTARYVRPTYEEWHRAIGYRVINEPVPVEEPTWPLSTPQLPITAKDLAPGFEAEQDLRIAQLEKLLAKYRESDKRMRFGIKLLCSADVITLDSCNDLLDGAPE